VQRAYAGSVARLPVSDNEMAFSLDAFCLSGQPVKSLDWFNLAADE